MPKKVHFTGLVVSLGDEITIVKANTVDILRGAVRALSIDGYKPSQIRNIIDEELRAYNRRRLSKQFASRHSKPKQRRPKTIAIIDDKLDDDWPKRNSSKTGLEPDRVHDLRAPILGRRSRTRKDRT